MTSMLLLSFPKWKSSNPFNGPGFHHLHLRLLWTKHVYTPLVFNLYQIWALMPMYPHSKRSTAFYGLPSLSVPALHGVVLLAYNFYITLVPLLCIVSMGCLGQPLLDITTGFSYSPLLLRNSWQHYITVIFQACLAIVHIFKPYLATRLVIMPKSSLGQIFMPFVLNAGLG